MTQPIDLYDLYFHWILARIGLEGRGYTSLLALLARIEYRYIHPLDANRYQDGISLRYIFGYENNVPDDVIAAVLDGSPCSVLEMMAALAIRSETDTMSNSYYGDRTYIWFRDMIKSLGLTRYTDDRMPKNPKHVLDILDRFMDLQYAPNGEGGLVTLQMPPTDLRTVDVWTQMSWKLAEYVTLYGG